MDSDYETHKEKTEETATCKISYAAISPTLLSLMGLFSYAVSDLFLFLFGLLGVVRVNNWNDRDHST